MKKLIAILLAVFMLCGCAFAEQEDWYLATAAEHALKVGELIKDEAYMEMYAPSMGFDCLTSARNADFGTMKSAYRFQLPDAAGVRVLLQLMSGGELSGAALERTTAGLPSLFITMYMGMQSAENLAAASIATYSRTYIMPEGFEPCFYLLELDGAVVSVAFSATGEDTITVNAQALFPSEAEDTIEDILNDLTNGMMPLAYEKVL